MKRLRVTIHCTVCGGSTIGTWENRLSFNETLDSPICILGSHVNKPSNRAHWKVISQVETNDPPIRWPELLTNT